MALPSPGSVLVTKRTRPNEKLTPKQIETFMKKNGISDQEFADIFGVTIQAVHLWLSGARSFSVTNSRLIRLFEKNPKLIPEF